MATIAIGDIHGNLRALNDVLDQIRGEGGPGDTFVFLGDYIDRGPDTRGCVDAILGFQRQVEAEVVCLISPPGSTAGAETYLKRGEGFSGVRQYDRARL